MIRSSRHSSVSSSSAGWSPGPFEILLPSGEVGTEVTGFK